ncbi:hypothetical protein ABVT39_021665 [Epinephelus coioides]
MEDKACDKWTDEEVQALLAFYGNDEIQRGFESSRRNEKIYQDISAHLDSLDIHHTAKQCREKLKKLKQDYKKLKDHNNRSGANRKVNKWYAQLDAILGHRPAYTGDPGTKDSAPPPQPSTTNQLPTLALEDISSIVSTASPDEDFSAEQQLETTRVTFMEPPSCSTPRHSESRRYKKRKRDIDIDALRELEEESRREAREERLLLFKTLAEHEERAAAA